MFQIMQPTVVAVLADLANLDVQLWRAARDPLLCRVNDAATSPDVESLAYPSRVDVLAREFDSGATTKHTRFGACRHA